METTYAFIALISIVGVPFLARKKGRSALLFLLLTFLIGPFALLPLYIRRKERTLKKQDLIDTIDVQIEFEQAALESSYVEPEDARVAACPSCGTVLKKIPGSKTKCPHCGEFMFIRTDPASNSRIVVTADQAEAIEDEWAKINGTWEDRMLQKNRFATTKAELSKQFGTTASDADVNWRLLNEDSIEHASMQNWGLYRNTIFQMGEQLRREGKLKSALGKYLLVCYIDTCGPNNISTPLGRKNEWGQKAFDQSSAFLAPGVTEEIIKAAKKSEMFLSDVEVIFMEMAGQYKGAVPFTKSPSDSWNEIKKELDQLIK
jgi:predicted RNA-binding Zn-ribbon protein involved in translation (DUF1610 family)